MFASSGVIAEAALGILFVEGSAGRLGSPRRLFGRARWIKSSFRLLRLGLFVGHDDYLSLRTLLGGIEILVRRRAGLIGGVEVLLLGVGWALRRVEVLAGIRGIESLAGV